MAYMIPTLGSKEQHSHASGTMIDVPGGTRPVEELEVGDMVRTKDNGYQPIRWIAARSLKKAQFAADPALRPIRIKAGALGAGRPARDLVVSQQHCILIEDWRCEVLFGEDEVLAPALALLNDSSITIDRRNDDVTYHYFMFDHHEIVYSNGVETESLHPATAAASTALGGAKRDELFKLFPELANRPSTFGPSARARLSALEVKVFMSC